MSWGGGGILWGSGKKCLGTPGGFNVVHTTVRTCHFLLLFPISYIHTKLAKDPILPTF